MGFFGGRRGIVAVISVALAISGCLVDEGGEGEDAIDDPNAMEAMSEETDAEASGAGGGGGSGGAPAEDPSGLCANQSCHQI